MFSSAVEVFGVVFEAWYSPVRAADGAVAGVIGVGTDITERCRAEAALRRSEESHRALVQHASYAIYRSSVDGRFRTVNPALVRMLRSEEHTSELQSLAYLVCRLLLEKKKNNKHLSSCVSTRITISHTTLL